MSPETAKVISSLVGFELANMEVVATLSGGAAIASGAGFALFKTFVPTAFSTSSLSDEELQKLLNKNVEDLSLEETHTIKNLYESEQQHLKENITEFYKTSHEKSEALAKYAINVTGVLQK